MIGPVETALKAALSAAVTDWPIRWANGQWEGLPSGWVIGDGGMPFDADGLPGAAIECEVEGGRDETLPVGKSQDGKRTHRKAGIFRLYLSVAQGSGLTAITAKSDAITSAFDRLTLIDNRPDGERLVTEDPRADDGVAGYEEGNRFCRMVSIPWVYLYRTTQK